MQNTTIAETTWRQLVRNFRRVFPPPQLTASAMVPPIGQHYLKGIVATSNISLLKVCQGEDVRCVDHTSSFTAYSGAPKQDMYRDPLHPSAKGTGRLACNIKYADRPRQRPALLKTPVLCSQDSSRPDSRAPTYSPFLTGRIFVRPNILRTLRRTTIRFSTVLLVRPVWFG